MQSSKHSAAEAGLVSKSQERRQRRTEQASSPSSRRSHASPSEQSASPSSRSPKSTVPTVHSEPNLVARDRQSNQAFNFDVGGSGDAKNAQRKAIVDGKPPARAPVQNNGRGDDRIDAFSDEKQAQNVRASCQALFIIAFTLSQL